MATDTQKCLHCQKDITDDDLVVLRDVLAGQLRPLILRHNEVMEKIGMPATPMEPELPIVRAYQLHAACYLKGFSGFGPGSPSAFMEWMIEHPWLSPAVFQYMEVEEAS